MTRVACRVAAALTTAAAVVLAVVYAPQTWFTPAFAVLIALAYAEYAAIVSKSSRLRRPALWLAAGLPVICGVAALPVVAAVHGRWMMLYLLAIVKVSDMGGFAAGISTAMLMPRGNHKMCPKTSPNKSWEGFAGSVAASVVVSLAFMPLTHFPWWKALAFGAVAAAAGTFGDLVESAFKRRAGVKDSAAFMPAGMGGLLDMLDSLLFAPALLLPFI
ncbi:MAG: phosphatidate cytidylyltransferase [Kiritimatiellae bacterium]|nr:phosphatidate cytidylyltransferase [Kiritimatiellia bacterium]